MKKFLPVVHIVDTEGPLSEPTTKTFKRIYNMFGLKIENSKSNLRKILEKKIDLPLSKKKKEEFYNTFNKNTLNYNSSWKKINLQNKIIFNKKFRNKYKDSFNKSWLINWNCVDHVGYKSNPQGRALGYHKIFDYYKNEIRKKDIYDNIYFHFHPMPLSKSANKSGNHFFSNSHNIFEILSRRIIERNWFPSVFSPGFHIERPDSHWFLEQFIPFDYGNQSCEEDVANNYRFENWEGAPKSWVPYHPDYRDYRKKGSCKRWIARSLNVGTRHSLLNQNEVNKAFLSIKKGEKAILSFKNHDLRNMLPDFDNVYEMLVSASKRYEVKFKFCDAREAFRKGMNLRKRSRLNFKLKFNKNILEIVSSHKTFGSQPFLSIQAKNGEFYHENFSIIKPYQKWLYFFDDDSLQMKDIKFFGFASNDEYGNTTIVKINFNDLKVNKYFI